MDIVPTGEALRRTDMSFALAYWHWFFMAQPYDLPERLISCDPEWYFRNRSGPDGCNPFDPEAEADYLEAYRDARTRHAMCEDYRAGVTIDYALDEADRLNANRIECPLLVLWAGRGRLESWYDVLSVWRQWASDVTGRSIDCGHYLAEEAAEETYVELRTFFSG
jgi:haloacetate dehalogenase